MRNGGSVLFHTFCSEPQENSYGRSRVSSNFFLRASLERFRTTRPGTPPFFSWNMREIISGYNEAMSFPGHASECVCYALVGFVIIVAILLTIDGPKISVLFLCGSYAFFLFLAFKSGFIRHDLWQERHCGHLDTSSFGFASFRVQCEDLDSSGRDGPVGMDLYWPRSIPGEVPRKTYRRKFLENV